MALLQRTFRQLISSKLVVRSSSRPTNHLPSGLLTGVRTVITLSEESDPSIVFDQIDKNGDGVIDKAEFLSALETLRYGELLNVHGAAKVNLENLSRKLDTVNTIEKHMEELECYYAEKKSAYNNIGLNTAADIEALFAKSKNKKDDIQDALGDLKSLIQEAKDIFTAAGDQQ